MMRISVDFFVELIAKKQWLVVKIDLDIHGVNPRYKKAFIFVA
jgi:hypothetical protein